MLLAIANGGFRGLVLVPAFGQIAGRIVSTILLCALLVAVAWATIAWLRPSSRSDALRVGELWLALTLGFEFGAGHFLFGAPWKRLLEDYNVARGRFWILVLISCVAAPVWVAEKRNLYGRKQAPPSGGIM
jgi:hypothetical protein